MSSATRHTTLPSFTLPGRATLLLKTRARPAILMVAALMISPGLANAQCPAFGADSGCGTIITITNTGATVTQTGQGPYDGFDDTLLGVVNNSNLPITSLGLASSLGIFAFDGDGIDVYGAPGNGLDNTGYGGPNAYFTNIGGGGTTGTVRFITPIATGGGTAYFSLENALNAATACSTIINNSITKPPGGGTQISSVFTPNMGYTLAQAADICGFTEWDWQQTITSLPAPSPFFAAGSTSPLTAPPPFNDPPPQGYAYQNPPNAVELPVYWNLFTGASDPLSLAANETNTTVSFSDAPADPCLPGGSGGPCGGHTAPAGSKLGFTTHLVGIQGALPGANVVDTGIGFTWTDTFNGTSGGIAVINSVKPVDPGSGTGGITVTSVNEITTYQAVTVTSVNGAPPGSTPTLGSGNACNGVFSGTFKGNVTVSAGQNCMFMNGTITGNVQANGGNVTLSGTLVGGDVQFNNGGTFSIGPFTTIDGNLQVQNLPSGSAANQICNATVLGNLQFQNNGTSVLIGAAPPSSCAGNVVGGNLEVQNNTAATSLFGNFVTGNLQDHNNTGATQVFSNTVQQSLQCQNNSAITGGANKARQKQGQCAAF